MDKLLYMKICNDLRVAAYMDEEDDFYDNRIHTTDELISLMAGKVESYIEKKMEN